MRLNRILLVTVAAGLALGGVTMQAGAQERRGNRGEALERAKEKLNLTDEQMGKVKEILAVEKDAIVALGQKLRTARTELRDVMQNERSNEKQVRDASARVAAVQADVNVFRHKLQGKIYPMLTAEQRQTIKDSAERIDQLVEQGLNRLGERLGNQ